jgi:hypothetical protein
MARFKYLGEQARPGWVVKYGPCQEIKTPLNNGTTQRLTPVPPNSAFVVGEDIGYDITDQRSLMSFRVDPRFQEITA